MALKLVPVVQVANGGSAKAAAEVRAHTHLGLAQIP